MEHRTPIDEILIPEKCDDAQTLPLLGQRTIPEHTPSRWRSPHFGSQSPFLSTWQAFPTPGCSSSRSVDAVPHGETSLTYFRFRLATKRYKLVPYRNGLPYRDRTRGWENLVPISTVFLCMYVFVCVTERWSGYVHTAVGLVPRRTISMAAQSSHEPTHTYRHIRKKAVQQS